MLKTLINRLNRILAPAGFTRSGTTWRRNHPVAFDVVGIQQAQFSTGVTVELGVYFKNLGNETNPLAGMGHLRMTLTGGGLAAWAKEFDDSAAQADQFAARLAQDGLPWFEVVKSKRGALEAMAQQPADAASPALKDAITYGTIDLV